MLMQILAALLALQLPANACEKQPTMASTWILSSWLQFGLGLAVEAIWGVSQLMEEVISVSLFLSLYLSNTQIIFSFKPRRPPICPRKTEAV